MKKQNKKFTKTKKLNEKDEAIVNRYTNQISRRIKEDQTEIKIYQSKRKRGHSFRFWVLEYIDNEGNTVKQEYKKKSVAYSIKAKLEKMALEGTLREKVYEGSLLSLLYELNDLCVTAPRSSKHAIQPSTHRSYESAIKRYHNFLNIPLTSLTIEYIEDVRSKTSYCVRSFNELINRLVHLRENFYLLKIGPNPILDLKFEASKLRSSKETVSSKPIFFNDLLEMRNMMVKDINSQNLNITSHVKKINIMFLSYCLANRISETISITPGQIKNALRDNEINIYQREVDCSRRVFGKSVMSLEGTKTKSKFENNDKIEQYSYIKPLLKSFKQIFEELCTLEYVIFINFLTLRITSDNINIRINSKGHALGLYFKSKKEYSINLNKCPRELTVVEFSRLIQSKVKELISLDEIFLSKDIEKKILRQTVFRVSKSSLNTNIKLYMKLIGRPGKHSSHGLRHGFVTETYTMLSKNEELNEQQRIDFIRKLTGHKKGSRVMEMIYIQVNTDVNELNKLNYGDELDEMTRELTNKPQMDVKVSESMSTSEKINQIVKRNLSHNDSVQSVLIKSIIVDCHREIGIELSEKEVSDILLKIA